MKKQFVQGFFVAKHPAKDSVDHLYWCWWSGSCNNLYLENLFYASCLPIETYNLLDYIHNTKSYEHRKEALKLKISYRTLENDIKKSRNRVFVIQGRILLWKMRKVNIWNCWNLCVYWLIDGYRGFYYL